MATLQGVVAEAAAPSPSLDVPLFLPVLAPGAAVVLVLFCSFLAPSSLLMLALGHQASHGRHGPIPIFPSYVVAAVPAPHADVIEIVVARSLLPQAAAMAKSPFLSVLML